jgi:hypothetical protein
MTPLITAEALFNLYSVARESSIKYLCVEDDPFLDNLSLDGLRREA